MATITEAEVEQAALNWLAGFGWAVTHGPDIAPGFMKGRASSVPLGPLWPG